MSKYLESVCLWEQNEKYLFSFEGFYVKFACKKKKPEPTAEGVRVAKCVQAWSLGVGYRVGAVLSCQGSCIGPKLEGTDEVRLGDDFP